MNEQNFTTNNELQNENNIKYLEVKQTKNSKQKSKSAAGISLALAGIYISGIILSFALLCLIFSGLSSDPNRISSNISSIFLIGFLILIVSIMFLIINAITNKGKSIIVKINIDDKNKCIKCNNEFPIENDECPNCHFKTKVTIDCPECGVINNIHRTKCVGCNREFKNTDIEYLLNTKKNSFLVKAIISGFFLISSIRYIISELNEKMYLAEIIIILSITALCAILLVINLKKYNLYNYLSSILEHNKKNNNSQQ